MTTRRELDLEDLRLAVYDGFARDGRAPDVPRLMAELAAPEDRVREGLGRLHDARHLVLGRDGSIVMAHPFSSVPLGFSVMGKNALWWGGCAWDAFAMPHLLPDEPEVLVGTRCPACGKALAWVVTREQPPAGEQVAHFLVPAAQMWNDIVHTCSNQRLYCGPNCVDRWLERSGEKRGCVLSLATLWGLARGWYQGRLERGYVRRDPVSAAGYFQEVGLVGPFWEAAPR